MTEPVEHQRCRERTDEEQVALDGDDLPDWLGGDLTEPRRREYRAVDPLGGDEVLSMMGQNCPLCGNPELGHDQAACDEKMRNWQPTGLSALFIKDDGKD